MLFFLFSFFFIHNSKRCVWILYIWNESSTIGDVHLLCQRFMWAMIGRLQPEHASTAIWLAPWKSSMTNTQQGRRPVMETGGPVTKSCLSLVGVVNTQLRVTPSLAWPTVTFLIKCYLRRWNFEVQSYATAPKWLNDLTRLRKHAGSWKVGNL